MTLIDCVLPRRFPLGTYTVVNPVSGFHLVFQCDANLHTHFAGDTLTRLGDWLEVAAAGVVHPREPPLRG